MSEKIIKTPQEGQLQDRIDRANKDINTILGREGLAFNVEMKPVLNFVPVEETVPMAEEVKKDVAKKAKKDA